jgi:hypothetical protein
MTWPIVILACQTIATLVVVGYAVYHRRRPTIVIRNVDFDNVLWLPVREKQRGHMRIVIMDNRLQINDPNATPIRIGSESWGKPYR